MTRRQKIAVSLPAHLVEAAKRAVRTGRAANVSAYVEQALEEKTGDEDLRELLDEMLAETGGPPTKVERRAAERILRGSKPKRR